MAMFARTSCATKRGSGREACGAFARRGPVWMGGHLLRVGGITSLAKERLRLPNYRCGLAKSRWLGLLHMLNSNDLLRTSALKTSQFTADTRNPCRVQRIIRQSLNDLAVVWVQPIRQVR